ncbi:type II toxin-antitoxin system HicB family antitoxin [Colwellia sp. D2M02]|uniref:type II toxin-antitoxin system HicB family antitoxin n=1 Tax=Colwellia sp. D2M02 TaxID=2841562 RepID=UPI001C09332C|nr:type II toxin-antitoxin system HicB family antitoxin [Colwellia sp. D2M02]MBU2894774.1 type II toxin-antitoxin system HicB family antitoxin [Colwellia sp. D2M02]
MKYPLLIEKKNQAFGYQVSVPDLPGCQANADSIDQAFENINAVIKSHLTILSEYSEPIPNGTSIEKQRALWLANRTQAQLITDNSTEVIWGLTELDITPYLGKSHKINVTLPELLISQIDKKVSKSPDYKTRSGFIASACIALLNK